MDKYDAKLFNDVYREISSICGVDTAVEMYSLYRGQQITFPTHLYSTECLKTALAAEYDGTNLRALARKYDYSEKTLRRLLSDK